ncbi:dUTP diphosphatase [Vagococcus fluvialis]|uniref:dUTP diphosphatase n=1 Tax=Vagococcus fluvialis TaxID=2738 RepID=UPI00203461A9|nr:dUTP diphosphatase [Vagococcus fluvialis]MCM2138837.1 dUTP diphosphatase [Vagococcus fluvialis]
MNFKKLQAMQEALDNEILSAKPQMTAEERFNKTLVALSVEVAEVANCAEHFKFWKDNKGKVDEKRFLDSYNSSGRKDGMYYDKNNKKMGLTRQQAHKLTLVEEASDCLHFILSLANQLEIELDNPLVHSSAVVKEFFYLRVNDSITSCFHNYSRKSFGFCQTNLKKVNFYFMNYINVLGITTQELEQAYYEKNEENYRRLREGY